MKLLAIVIATFHAINTTSAQGVTCASNGYCIAVDPQSGGNIITSPLMGNICPQLVGLEVDQKCFELFVGTGTGVCPVGGKCIFTFENLSLIFKGDANGSETCAQIAGDGFVTEVGVPLCYVEATTLNKDEQLKVLLKALIAAIVTCFHKHKDSYDGNRVLELEDKADIKALLINLLEEKLELDLETSL